ncbi:MAG: hypothetical protein MI725_11375, partial [Pirellulales bacterium]|nr:hypothetical protein [Pirellulales bacterium]
ASEQFESFGSGVFFFDMSTCLSAYDHAVRSVELGDGLAGMLPRECGSAALDTFLKKKGCVV